MFLLLLMVSVNSIVGGINHVTSKNIDKNKIYSTIYQNEHFPISFLRITNIKPNNTVINQWNFQIFSHNLLDIFCGMHSKSINTEDVTIKKLWAEVSNIETRNALKKPKNPPNKKLFCKENDVQIDNRQ